ncbi:hypothetical protein FKM82_021621 [Ascaphus truei]
MANQLQAYSAIPCIEHTLPLKSRFAAGTRLHRPLIQLCARFIFLAYQKILEPGKDEQEVFAARGTCTWTRSQRNTLLQGKIKQRGFPFLAAIVRWRSV